MNYEEAVSLYYERPKQSSDDPPHPNKQLSYEDCGIWHLNNVNGALAIVVDGEVFDVSEFWNVYERLAEEGKCDSPGGGEYRRVLIEWLDDQPDDMEEFIVHRANASPDEQEANVNARADELVAVCEGEHKKEANTTRPRNQIVTGYKVGGRTWISDKWNNGTLTREDIYNAIDSDSEYKEDELRSQLLESEAETAKEMFDDEGGTKSYEECLEWCVEDELRRLMDEQDHISILKEILQELYDEWTDDSDDYFQLELVCMAHNALDTHCRKLQYGEFGS